MKDIVVLVLAGGDGDRFWPFADKHSMPFFGRTLAYQTLSQLRKFGFKNIVIVVSSSNELVFNRVKKEFSDLLINLVIQTDLRGQAGAILSAKKFIKGKKLLVINGADIYEDLLLASLTKNLKHNPDGIIVGIKQDIYFLGGYLKLSKEKIIGVVEKPPPENIPSNIVKLVFDYFSDADLLLNAISKITSSTDDIFEKAIDLLINEGLDFKFLQYKGFWGSLKYPWHVLDITSYYLHKLSGLKIKKAFVHKSASISGNVIIEEGVKILENTKILGPAYIGRGSVIGQNCLVRESIVGANCVVGYSTEIARSYIGDNCWFHTNYVGDSVICDNVSMGAGAVLANYKLDETTIKSSINQQKIDTAKVKLGSMIGKNVRIGVNCSIMPGVKIGMNSFVGAAVLLDKDLPDNKYCLAAGSNYVVKDNLVNISKKTRVEVRSALKI